MVGQEGAFVGELGRGRRKEVGVVQGGRGHSVYIFDCSEQVNLLAIKDVSEKCPVFGVFCFRVILPGMQG